MRVLVASIINQIRQNLRDRYKSGFPILKELIQNADDAYAKRIDLVFSPGIPLALHPLLHGPALIVINDGTFDEKNARAINCIGLSSKAGNPNAVGRYGLGLKSVFHLCEAFFFLSNIDPMLHIVNPWAEMDGPDNEVDKVYPEWNNLTEGDARIIRSNLEPVLKSYDRFLCIWIPLRKESHFDKRHSIIRQTPGENWDEVEKILNPAGIQPNDLANELGRLFPQLRTLEILRLSRLSDSKKTDVILNLKLGTDSTRLVFPAQKIEPNIFKQFQGDLTLQTPDGKFSKIEYVGVEKFLLTSVFQNMGRSGLWPRHSNEDPVNHDLIEQRDNAKPHIAAVFLRFPATAISGALSINRAVFLPLEKQSEVVQGEGNRCFGLTLHGWFFVDAGRTELHGWDRDYKLPMQTGDDLSLSWNGALAQLGTLQAVIPALDHFVTSLNLSVEDVSNLTSSVQKSELYRFYKQFICENDQWFNSYNQNGSKWVRVPATQEILELPKPPESDKDRPGKVFPAISKMPAIVIEGSPRLSLEDKIHSGTVSDLIKLLSSMPILEVFSSQGMLDYLGNVLEKALHDPELKPVSDPRLAVALLSIMREAFANLELKILDRNRGLIKRICGLIPPEYKYSIRGEDEDLRKPASLSVLRNIFQLEIELLIMPGNFNVAPVSGAQHLSFDNAEKILRTLAKDVSASETITFEDIRSQIAIQIFDNFAEPYPLILRCGDLRLFKGIRFFQGSPQEVFLTLTELRTLDSAELLFQYTLDGARSDRIVRDLSMALDEVHPVIIKREVNSSLKRHAADSSPVGCLRLLEKLPSLSEPSKRRDLVRQMLAAVDSSLESGQKEKLNAVLRFLLHGQANQYTNTAFLYTQDGDMKVSQTLAKIILKHKQEGWRILDSELARVLTDELGLKLHITELGDISALSLLRSLPQDQLCSLDFSEISGSERNQIIVFLYQHNGNDLLRRLSIHETQAGELVCLTMTTFLESNFNIPTELASDAVLLHIPSDLLLLPVYKDLGVTSLSAEATIRLAIDKEKPERYWHTIMDALYACDCQVDAETLNAVRENSWLPTLKDDAISPGHVLHISGLEKEIAGLLAEIQSVYTSYSNLSPSLVAHSTWNISSRLLLPDKREVTKNLGRLISESEKYRVGNIDTVKVDEEFLQTFRFVFEQPRGFEILPVASIIQKIDTYLGSERAVEFLRLLCRPVSTDRVIRILEHTSQTHEITPKDNKLPVLSLFESYLASISEQPEMKDVILPAIRLMNRNKKWKSSNLLVHDAKGIDPEDLLDGRQGKLLRLSSGQKDPSTASEGIIVDASLYEQDLRSGAKQLLAYFAEWEPYIQNKEVLGGFLSLLGDQFDIKRQAGEYLGKREIKETREILEWRTDASTFHSGEDVSGRLQRQSFIIRIVETQTTKVVINSISGKEFEATLQSESSLEHLLYDSKTGPIPPHIKGGKVFDFICLRKIRLDQTDPVRLMDLLKRTAKQILYDVYYQDIRNFDEFWQELEQTDQLDIEIAQDTIIETAFSYIPSLGLATHQEFRPRIKAWEDIRNREIQTRKNARRKGIEVTQNFEKEREKLRESLKNLLEATGSEGQNERDELLKAIRYKIGQEYQYKRDSILFELFQNADDAVAELGVLLSEVPSRISVGSSADNLKSDDDSVLAAHHRRIVVDWSASYIRFAHWGRAVNQIHPGSGEVYGYGDDLVKMLMMQRSDKLLAAQLNIKPLTGKFGLGFKSVFLVSRKPSILSGRIKFEIVAGLYPMRMKAENLDHISMILEGWSNGKSQNGTLIDLPMDLDGIPSLSAEVVTHYFYQWAELLAVFSHEINRIELRQDGRIRRTIEWQPERLIKDSNWFIGKLQNIGSGGKSAPANALVWKTSKVNMPEDVQVSDGQKDFQGSFLLALDQNGCTFLDPTVPRIWVTAPSEEFYPVGFVLNTNFALDVGRAQLARASEDNRFLAQDLGNKIGESLLDLFNYTRKNWPEFCLQAGLNCNLTEYSFWESVWKVVCEPMRQADSREGYELLRIFLDKGFSRLYKRQPALPTGLPGDYQSLTKLQDLRFYTSGILEKPEIFIQVANWPIFQEKAPIGSVIPIQIKTTLFQILTEKPDLNEISLWKVLEWIIGSSGNVTPEKADLLGQIVSPAFINGLEPSEKEVIRQYLKKLMFKSRNGKFFNATDMLAENKENLQDYFDEMLRMLFAPDGLVISSDYSRSGTQFFRACREELSAPVEKLVVWAFEAKDRPRQMAVLNYLLRGERADALTQAIINPIRRDDFERSWLCLLSPDNEPLKSFISHDQNIILGRLRINEEPPEPLPDPLPPARYILETIHTWWEQNQATLIKDYENDVYPNGELVVLTDDLELLDEPSIRREWMILFLLGSFHTIGRIGKETYRNFIDDCHKKGWLDTFARSDAQADDWINVLDSYLENISEDDDAKYQYLFMRQFVQIYKLASYLPNYVEVFLSINRIKSHFSLDQITNPNKSELFSGSGIPIMPKISNTLGIGTGFVLRELVRQGLITSPYVFEHCYSPVSRVKRLFMDLGFTMGEEANLSDSTKIYQFLVKNLGEAKATFNKSFDIPFLVIAEKYGDFKTFLENN